MELTMTASLASIPVGVDHCDAATIPRHGTQQSWEFLDPLSDGATGFARFRFSYISAPKESAGRPVLFEGMSSFYFREELILRYREAFDRGVALVQLDFPAERIKLK
jgi:hypothetical protein